jgi:translation initiation factor IF-1
MKLIKLKHGDRIIVRPHCEDCTKTPARVKEKKKKLENSIDELMGSILPKGV